MERNIWRNEKMELRNYIFATDTTKTTNSILPWKNKTTLPKLCSIRDNLHANYMAAIFPNDNWLKWEAHTEDANDKEKRKAIQAYMSNKTRESGFRQEVAKLLYDYIDYGNAFAEVQFVDESRKDEKTGEKIEGYIGPKLVRLSPFDHAFNPLASEYKKSPKITRYIKTVGELENDVLSRPDLHYSKDILAQAKENRNKSSGLTEADWAKQDGISIDGFGNLQTYYQTGYVEILEFEGDMYDYETDTFLKDHIITVIDRNLVLRKEPTPSWLGASNKVHAGWRLRPDNLYAMGPLDNLVGMQYRIDHLENIKADLYDLIAHPPVLIKGNVEEFEFGPLAQIFLGDDGSVDILKIDATALQADVQIQILEQKMEEFAGAPKQAMGIRTPGEKTAFEVQRLENASGRIFQDKTTNFEIHIIEPALNTMLEVGRRELNGADLISVMDDDLGVTEFLNITRADITAKGKLRPIGARHFAAQAQLVQNLTSFANTALGQDPAVTAHISGKKLAKLFEEVLGLEKFGLVQDNVRVMEQAETQRLVNQVGEDLEVEQSISPEAEEASLPA